ncbi:MAG TPA: right-handed parallel beta-helix repeat-containing protein, partial [Tepidisphaeraceae bacterium]|nr:right-handed parallel beta-helix repeat-containing protein [Tepidisphaeraceae bacterium]
GLDDDDLYGNAGGDVIHGDEGVDRIWGGDDGDVIFGDGGADVVRGDGGNDTVSGNDGDDELLGGVGDDSIEGGAGADLIFGGDGDDVAYGQVNGGAGDDNAADQIYGENGADQLFGNGGADVLDGGLGVDTVRGGSGDDHLAGGGGVGDSIAGEDGNDQIVGSDDGADVDANFGDAVYFGDVIDGGIGDDTIDALGGADNIDGGEGNDSIDSGAGRDLVHGSGGNDWIFGGIGTFGDQIFGDAGADLVYGAPVGNDTVGGGDDNDRIFGQGGQDVIGGDGGDDYLDGGGDADAVSGGVGNDELLGGGGTIDTLDGGQGDDVLRGSDDGADSIVGGDGRDRIFSNGGNDTALGGLGADTIDGGAGDDLISGDEGSDLLLGGANHDVIFGHRSGGAGDDNAVDYIYGDFGTNANEAGSGRDQIFGQGGNDLMFGEGEDDQITAGGGASNLVNFGVGEGGNPNDFVPPTPTAAPPINAVSVVLNAGGTLPVGVGYLGRWDELSSSASGSGASASRAEALEETVAAGTSGRYIAWADARNGNFEVYVARYTASGWEMLSGSAQDGGVSSTSTSSRRPSITLDGAGNPLVAWTEFTSAGSEIRAAKFQPGTGWISLGTVSSGAGSAADGARIVNTASGPVVGWLNTSGGVSSVFVKQFNGATWNAVGSSASGAGISSAGVSAANLAMGSDGAKVAFGWSQDVAGVRQVYLKELSGGTFNQLSSSASGGGVSATAGNSDSPTVAYSGSSLVVAWQNEEPITRVSEIFAVRYDGAGTKTVISASGGGVSNTHGQASQARLAAGGSALYLVWADDRLASRNATGSALYVRKWNGSGFVEELSNDASFGGVASAGSAALSMDLAVDSAGKPFVAWDDQTAGTRQVMARANSYANVGNIFITSAALSVQNILDTNDLGPGDVILVSGSSGGFNVGGNDAGVLIQGLPGSSIAGNVTLAVGDVILNRLSVTGSVTISSDRDGLYNSAISSGVTVNGGSNSQLAHNTINGPTALTLTGSAAGTIVEHNTIGGTATGLAFSGAGASGAFVRDNKISGATGVSLAVASSGTLRANDISATTTGLNIAAVFTGSIDGNDIHGATTGVSYAVGANLNGNRIHNNASGVVSTVSGTLNGFGFVAPSVPNEIYSNVTGVNVTGQMQNQHIWANTTGVIGSGILGGSDFAFPNAIEKNATGVSGFTGTIQFNRISANTVGISAVNGQKIFHDLIYRNTQQGILVSGKSDVRIVSNTMVAPTGDNIRIQNSSSSVEIRDNILWAETGYDIFAANDSLIGYWSDYNQLHSGPGGKLVHWVKDFSDILDWQADVAQFDLHSIGTTVMNPLWSQPAFVNASLDDYRIFDIVAGQRFSSPGIEGGDPLTDQGLASDVGNLLVNGGFESGITGWSVSPSGSTKSSSPAAFEGTSYFFAGTVPAVSAEQTIDLVAAGFSTAQLDSQDLVAIFGGRVRSLAETLRDRGQIVLSFLTGVGGLISQRTVAATNTSDRWELIGDHLPLPVGTRQIRYRFEATMATGANNDSYLDGAFLRIMSETGAPDLGAYGNTAAEGTLGNAPHIALRSPDLYVDWERDRPRQILWDSYGNSGDSPVKIELYRDTADGPEFVLTIAAATADTGSFTWIPGNSGVNFGTNGLRIQISYVTNQAVLDRSTEPFSVPTSGDNFYVDDASNVDDQYTPAGIGSNRNTGKLPTAPKPYPNNILRVYTLGPAQTLFVDDGSYSLLSPIGLSGAGVLSDDEGFTFTGPTAAGTEAVLTLANPNTVAPIIELDDADFTTINYLTLADGQYGIWGHNGSTNFASSHLTVSGNDLDGVRFETLSTVAGIDHLHAFANGRYGIYVSGEIASLSDSSIHNNANNGAHLLQPRGVIVEGNEVFANGGDGIYVDNNALPAATIGNANLGLGRGNRVHDNSGSGIRGIFGSTVVVGNAVYGHSGTNDTGIIVDGASSSASRNVVYNNFDGINATGGALVSENRSYHNSNFGIGLNVVTGNSSNATRNVVYANNLGFIVGTGFSGQLANNLIYANNSAGVEMRGAAFSGGTAKLINNTIYQPVGDGVRLLGTSRNVELRNNILVVGAARAINVAADSQQGFKSDYNLFRTTGAGRVGFWQGTDRPTLASWQGAVFVDQNSLFQDPLFVDADGVDNLLGFASSIADGNDDDLHVQSQAGSFHGGALAPISVDGGLPVFVVATEIVDVSQSPAIDRGDASDAFANEPTPNGGFINLGFEGNTNQASKSPASYMLVTVPDGGEAWLASQTFPIRWRSHNTAGTVDVELMQVGNPTPVLLIADDTGNDGEFQWTIPGSITPADNYLIRVTRNDTATSDVSNAAFSIGAAITIYFVNDGTVAAGDWTTAVGNDANNGLSPATPKASIRAILETYDLGPGDIIRVDNGSYTLTTNIPITANDSGVLIEGYHDVANPTGRALINRGSTTGWAFEMSGGDDVTIDHMQITGGAYGIGSTLTSDSDRLSVTNSIIFSNSSAGIAMLASNDGLIVSGSTFFSVSGAVQPTGLIIDGTGASITNNDIRDHSNFGISVTGGGSLISNNDIRGSSRGITAGTPSTVTNRITISGNVIHDNLTFGIDAARFVLISGNKIYRHEGTNDAAINMTDSTSEARDNVVFDNYNGIFAAANVVIGNRVYNASNNAILAGGASLVQGNSVYSNRVGIATTNNFNGRMTNNRVYGNTLYGVQLNGAGFFGGGNPLVINNTIYEPTATAIRVEGTSRTVSITNNILYVGNGYGISMADDSQQGFVSDYNLFYLSGSGKVGSWEGRDYFSRLDWAYEVGIDRHSVSGDPMLVDVDGADNVLGFSAGPVGPATIIDDGDSGFSTTGTWAASTPGFNGDYRQNTGSATASWTFSGLIPGAYYTLAATWPVKATFDTSTV